MSTSQTSPTSHISHAPDTTHTSHTTHTVHTSHTSQTSRTSHEMTHQTTPQTTTTPAFAVATVPCYQDNELRALESHSQDVSRVCSIYIRNHADSNLPNYLSQFGRSQMKSACSCFDGKSTATPVKTEADFELTSSASTSSASASAGHSSKPSSKPSTSTARGSVVQGNKSNCASIPSPGRFAVTLVSVLVISSVVALLNGP